MKRLLICPSCRTYTLKDFCHEKTVSPRPPKYSPQDRYAQYRRMAKKEGA
ncbi:MAG TPA: nucleolar RNA-binding Nop10p family protein [Candidatus Nanoarchaeia archaeon]|nr:nucleolar RNA-binding Nop10p family protein [Candidatus Nanoarchaeia archaeon]